MSRASVRLSDAKKRESDRKKTEWRNELLAKVVYGSLVKKKRENVTKLKSIYSGTGVFEFRVYNRECVQATAVGTAE